MENEELQRALGSLGAFVKSKTETSTEDRTSNYLTKLYMVVPENQGNIYMIPCKSNTGTYFSILDNVRELRLSMSDDPDQLRWIKLLPREFYTFQAGSREEILYNELVAIHNQMKDNIPNAWKNAARFRNYLLIYGYILSHRDVNGDEKNDKGMSLVIFDHKRMVLSLNAEIESNIQMRGGTQWLEKIYNPNDQGKREGFMKLTYFRNPGNSGDWTSLVQFSSFNSDNIGLIKNLVPPQEFDSYLLGSVKPSISISDAEMNKIGDHVNQLINVDNNDGRFNYDYYTEVKRRALSVLSRYTPVAEPAQVTQNQTQSVQVPPTPEVVTTTSTTQSIDPITQLPINPAPIQPASDTGAGVTTNPNNPGVVGNEFTNINENEDNPF